MSEPLIVDLDDDLFEALQQLASRENTSVDEFVCSMLREVVALLDTSE